MSEPLAAIERRMFRSRGYLYEGDVFSALRRSPFALRSFEFALCDGALDCTHRYNTTMSWGQRFWTINSLLGTQDEASDLALFEVKSSVAGDAGQQVYEATRGQQRRVAFYIGICAADPRYVDLVPNYLQDPVALQEFTENEESESEQGMINFAKVSRLPPSAYGYLDPSMSPYRMPMRLLPEALERVRDRIRHGKVYVNPGTQVAFPEWHPITTKNRQFLKPAAQTAQHSAYLQAEKIVQVANHTNGLKFSVDFVNIQPRLADLQFKWLSTGQELYVQLKIDDHPRKEGKALEKVSVARTEGNRTSYYFSAFDRWDFLLYQFTYTVYPNDLQVFYCIPEKAVPDEFYTSTASETSFAIPEFEPCRVEMDGGGDWVLRLQQIIAGNLDARKPGERPYRLEEFPSTKENDETEEGGSKAVPSADGKHKGTRDYKAVMVRAHNAFFYRIMRYCAQRRSGLLLVLARNSPFGDFGMCRYSWSVPEQEAFVKHLIPPRYAHDLSPDVVVVPICYYTQHAETSFQGPSTLATVYRRLNSCEEGRLIIWDIGGFDTPPNSLRLAVVPSEDFSPTDEQRALLNSNLDHDKDKSKTPSISSLLSSGKFLSDYAIGNPGPFTDDISIYAALYHLLTAFLDVHNVEHPLGQPRRAVKYRHMLRDILQRLSEEHRNNPISARDPYEA